MLFVGGMAKVGRNVHQTVLAKRQREHRIFQTTTVLGLITTGL